MVLVLMFPGINSSILKHFERIALHGNVSKKVILWMTIIPTILVLNWMRSLVIHGFNDLFLADLHYVLEETTYNSIMGLSEAQEYGHGTQIGG